MPRLDRSEPTPPPKASPTTPAFAARAAWALVALVAGVVACRAADHPAVECRPLADARVVQEQYEIGLAKLEESRDGEHLRRQPFEAALVALRFAADNGHRSAQSLYGRSLFGALFASEAPRASQREDYVSALTFLRVAARAGDEPAARFIPGLAAEGEPPLEPPLDSLPPEWLAAAVARADAWVACHGLPTAPGSGRLRDARRGDPRRSPEVPPVRAT